MTDRMVLDTALRWHLAQETMDADGWLRFTDWLEADPTHAAAYDTVSVADAMRHAEAAAPAPAPANDNAPARHRQRWFGAGLAAAAVFAGVITLRPADDSGTIVATAPRTVRLGDGSSVALAANTRLTLDGSRGVRLDGGRATFHVTHDAAHPFAVRVAGWTVRDVGTVFTVTHTGGGLDVGVSEGAILLDAMPLKAGEAVSIAAAGAAPVRSALADGGARVFRFSGENLGEVARTVGLALNVPVAAIGDAAARPFLGVLRLTGDARADIPHLAAMTGMRSNYDGRTWTIGSAQEAAR